MKTTVAFHILMLLAAWTFAQNHDSLSQKKPTIIWGGFVRADAIFDTRQVVEAREGYLLLYPKNVLKDADDHDVNAHGSFNQYAMLARLRTQVNGPDVLKAITSAYLEGDFSGPSNLENNSFRLRHAYAKLAWPHIQMLAGQFWHPLDVPEMIPDVLSLNTGAPFHSFSRQPQIRTDLKIRHVNLVLVASSQRDYVNTGPEKDSSSYLYLRNSMIPNIHIQLQHIGDAFFVGAGVDYKRLTPRLKTSLNYEANERVDGISFTGFIKLTFKPVIIKSQVVLGQMLNDHLMLGGYGVNNINALTDRRTYQPLSHFSAWASAVTTGKKMKVSLFLGYTQSNGAKDSLIAPFVYARGIDRFGQRIADIDYLYRISPMITWNLGQVSLAGELELTVAAYGPADSRYRIISSTKVANLRTTLSLSYNF
jgi:hypothetical protein